MINLVCVQSWPNFLAKIKGLILRVSHIIQQRKLTIILCVLLTCSFLAVSLLSYYSSKKTIHLALVEKELPLTSNAIYAELQKDLIRPFFISSMMGTNTFLHDWTIKGEQDVPAIARYLKETKEEYQVFTSFFVSEKTHRYYYPNGVLKTVSAKDNADRWFFRVRELNEPYEINIDYDKANNNSLAIFMNFRVFNQQQQFLGVTGVGVSMERLYQLLGHYEQQYKKNIFLVDKEGKIRLTGNNRLQDPRSIWQINGLKDYAAQLLSRQTNIIQYKTKDGKKYLVHVRYMPEVRLYLFVESREDEAIAEVKQTLYINMIVLCFIVIATILLTNMTVGFYQRELKQLASLDGLTQLLNRQAFEIVSERLLADSRRHQQSLSVMIADVDFFKRINDSYGHQTGDLVLKQVALALRESVRESDVVCRWGGEEFALFLPKCALDDAERIAEKIRQHIEELALHEAFYSVPVTISIGVAEYQVTESLKDVFARADKALYRAKAGGRNQVVVSY